MSVTTDTLEALPRTSELRNTDVLHVMRDPDLVGRQDVALTGAHLLALKNGSARRGGIISMGASAVGTTQHNTGLEFGTGDLSLGAWVRLPDWTPSATRYFLTKSTATLGVYWYVTTAGNIGVGLGNGVGFTEYTSTAATGVVDGAWAFVSATLDRDGNLVFGINGAQLGTAISIAAQSAQSLTGTGALSWLSNSSAGTLDETFIVSGLLSASRIADIYRAGSIAPFCVYTANTTTGQNTATVDGLSFFQWLDCGQGYGPIIRDRSGNNQHAAIGTSGIMHAVYAPRVNHAPRFAMVGDGSAGSFVRSTLGNQNPSTGDFVLGWSGMFVPSTRTAAYCLAILSPSTNETRASKAFQLYYDGAADVVAIRFYGATASDYRALASPALYAILSALGAEGVETSIFVRRSSAGIAVFLGIGRDRERFYNVTYMFGDGGTGGTPPAWTDQVDGQYLIGFYRTTVDSDAHTLYDLRLANVAMTEGQLRTEYERGEPGPEWRRATNSGVITNGDFEAGAGSWTTTAAGASTSALAAGAGVGGSAAWELAIDGSNSSATLVWNSGAAVMAFQQYYRLQVTLKVDSVVNAPVVSSDFVADVSTGFAWTVAPTTDFVTYTAIVRIAAGTGGAFNIKRAENCAGVTITIDDISLVPVGYTARLRTDTAAGLTALNAAKSSTNDSTDFLLSTTGVTVSPNHRRQIIRPGTLTFTSPGTLNLQLFGASLVDTSKKWRIVSFSGTANGAANLSLGSASAGAQYFSAQAVTAADFDVSTFVSRRISGANVWLASSATVTISDPVLILEQID